MLPSNTEKKQWGKVTEKLTVGKNKHGIPVSDEA